MSSRSTRVHLLLAVLSLICALIIGYGCEKYQLQQPVNNPPPAPINPSPANDTTMAIESLTPTLSWTSGDDVDEDALIFDIMIGNSATDAALLVSTDSDSFAIDVGQRLSGSGVIYWSVIARDSRGATTSSEQWAFRTGEDMNLPPTAFSSPVPADGDTGVAVNVLLQWYGGEDPEEGSVTFYTQLDTLEDFSSVAVVTDSTLNERYFRAPDTLTTYTTYYWQVTAVDSVAALTTGPVWSFTTGGEASEGNDPPNPVGRPVPDDGATEVSVTLYGLSWGGSVDPDGDPVRYSIYLGEVGNPQYVGTAAGTSYNLSSALTFLTGYEWRVDAMDDHGNVTPGPTWSFISEVNDPPTPLTNPTPGEGAPDQLTNVTLTWQGGEDPEDLFVEYLVYLAPAGSDMEFLGTTSQQTISGATRGVLTHEIEYVWRVDARDSEGLLTTGPDWSFTTETNNPPSAPAAPTPPDAQLDVAANTSLSWGGCVDPESDPVEFEVRLSTTTPPTAVETVQVASFTPAAALDYETTYYWQIVVRDPFNLPVTGPIWSLTTAASQAPTAPCPPITPEDEATGVESSVELTWGCGVDPEGDPVTYDLLFGAAVPLGQPLFTGIETQSYTLHNLVPHTTYYWQVRATDSLTTPVGGPIWSFTTYNTPPTQVSDPDPADLAVDITQDATLGWSAATDADGDDVTYRVLLDTVSPPTTEEGTTAATAIDPDTLVAETVYYWQVVAEDAYGGATPGLIWRFTTGVRPNTAPELPSTPSPSNAATDVGLDAAISWVGTDPEGDQLFYDLYFGTTNPPSFLFTTLTAAYDPPGDLEIFTTYYWKIVADDGQLTTVGAVWSFTTGAGPNQAPTAPANPVPVDAAVDVARSVTLTWDASTDPDGDDITYAIHFGTTNPPASVHVSAVASYDPPGELEGETLYYWQIAADDDRGGVTWGPVWSFTTAVANEPPNAPTNPSPANGATDVAISVTLTWTASTDPDEDDIIYNIYFGTSNPPGYANISAVASYDPPGDLAYSTQFYWRIAADDQQGGVTSGPVWTFSTAAEANQPPAAPAVPDPENGAAGVDVLTNLSWAASVDPNGDPVVYDVYLDTSNPPALVSADQSAVSYNPPAALDHETTYFWQIVAQDDQGGETVGPLWTLTTAAAANNAPATPVLESPDDAATDIAVTAAVSWFTAVDPDGDPVTYEVYFDTTNPPSLVGTQADTTYDPAGSLANATTYYWRIKAKDDRGGESLSEQRSFTTVAAANQAPPAPSAPNPADAATDVSITADMSWTASVDPDGDPVVYDVYFGPSYPPSLVSGDQSATTYDPGTMSNSTTYYWRVKAKDDQGGETYSAEWDFTTEAANQPPPAPSAPNPADAATDVSITADMSWTASVDPDGDPVVYDVYFGPSYPPSLVSGDQSATTYDPGTMSNSTTYYWRVKAKDDQGGETYSAEWDFTTEAANQPPPAPSAPSPADAATDVSITADMSWTASVDPDGDPVVYDVYFGPSYPPSLVSGDQSATTYDPGTMSNSTTYYWRVKAKDDQGGETYSAEWDFTTEAANQAPPAPSAPNPADAATDVDVSSNLSWNASVDPDGDPVVYDVYLGTSSPPGLVAGDQSATSYSPPGVLDYSTLYYWKVVAKDDRGGEGAGAEWTFTTAAAP